MCLFHIENKKKQQRGDKNTPELTMAQLVQQHLHGLCQRVPSSFLPQSKNMHIRLIETKLPPGVSEWCVSCPEWMDLFPFIVPPKKQTKTKKKQKTHHTGQSLWGFFLVCLFFCKSFEKKTKGKVSSIPFLTLEKCLYFFLFFLQ